MTTQLRALGADVVLDRSVKGFPSGQPAIPLRDVGRQGWELFGSRTTYPLALLRTSALARNLATMQQFCRTAGVELAPHAKTTMVPELVADQLDAGAWAMTAANARQVLQLWDFGVPRVLLANEVVDDASLTVLAQELAASPDRELMLFADSTRGVAAAERAMASAGGRPLPVVLDLGHEHGRTGVRDVDVALIVADAIRASEHLRLAGVGGFEGTIGTERSEETLQRVDDYLRFAVEVGQQLVAAGSLSSADGFVATFGGSAFFDRVVDAVTPLRALGATVVLRSGCYLLHDHGIYARATPAATDGWQLPTFAAALEVWASVISRPEPGLVLLNAGKRDLSFDAGLPVAIAARAQEPGRLLDVRGLAVSALSDQHAFLPVPPDHPITVGDVVGLGISHPCTTVDRWPLLYLADDDDRFVGAVRPHL